jgi:hypothetical protein
MVVASLLAGCAGEQPTTVACDTFHLIEPPLGCSGPLPADYEMERDRREPGYHAKMNALRADPAYQERMRRIDYQLDRLDRTLAQERLDDALATLQRDPVVIYHYRHRAR